MNEFKTGKVDYLLATDLASRGLDIKGVETVINYDMPGQLSQYTHRVGRTARAGRKGRYVPYPPTSEQASVPTLHQQRSGSGIRGVSLAQSLTYYLDLLHL